MLYLHIRLDFDQRIFANSQNFNEFDRTLVILGLLKQTKERSVTERAKGAIHLWYRAFLCHHSSAGIVAYLGVIMQFFSRLFARLIDGGLCFFVSFLTGIRPQSEKQFPFTPNKKSLLRQS